jgi:hypothetical protein
LPSFLTFLNGHEFGVDSQFFCTKSGIHWFVFLFNPDFVWWNPFFNIFFPILDYQTTMFHHLELCLWVTGVKPCARHRNGMYAPQQTSWWPRT